MLSFSVVFLSWLLLSCGDIESNPGPYRNDMFKFTDISSFKGVKIGHVNACSLPNKIDDITKVLIDSKLAVLMISETSLSDRFVSSSIDINGYHLKRQDRPGKRGGGICMYVSDKYSCDTNVEMCISSPDSEILGSILTLPSTKPIILITVYRPPSGNTDRFIEEFAESLDATLKYPGSEIYILGDFNCVIIIVYQLKFFHHTHPLDAFRYELLF